jgi:glycosyltransferase involved in cell wall biosynthesis
MRIVQAVGWYFPSSVGGTEVYVAALARRLQGAGHEVLIAAPDAVVRSERTYDYEGVQVYRYPIEAPPTRNEAQGRVAARGAERFHGWLQRVRPDVVHAHTFVTGLGLAELRAAKALGSRVIATTHAASLGFTCARGTMMRWGTELCSGRVSRVTCTACQLDHRGLTRPLGYAAALVPPALGAVARHVPGPIGTAVGMTELITHNQHAQREMLTLVDRYVVLTEWARSALLANGGSPDKIIVNRLGVRFPPPPRLGGAPGPLTVAYIGRFEAIKGVEDFARAIAAVPTTLPIRFEFHGPVRNRAEMTALERMKLLAGRDAWVTIGPELDAEGVQSVLGRIDLLCSPSRVVEGGPTIALEANAAGVPVVGTDLPGLSEIVTQNVNGRLVPPGDWKALARVFRELAADRSIVQRWRDALGPVRTMDDVTDDYMRLYEA